MKIKVFYFVTTLLFFTSCADFLEEKPLSITSSDQFFKTPEQAIAAVNGVYSNLYTADMFRMEIDDFTVFGTDLIMPTRALTRLSAHYYTLSETDYATLPLVWRALYKAIGDANLVIDRVGESDIDTTTKNRVIGEAKFLRAFFYYYLTNMWGDVPLWTEELKVDEVSTLPRASVVKIREQMLEDLTEAEQYLPSEYVGKDLGRATKWAAKGLMTKIYLIQKDWIKAREAANDIIVNSHHKLLINYADVFDKAKSYNDEIIFTIDFLQDIASTNRHSRFSPRGIDEPKIPGVTFTGFGIMTPSKEFVASFSALDKRKAVNAINQVNGVTLKFTYMPKFWDIEAPRDNSGNNYIVLRLADVMLMYAEAENELNSPTTQAYDKLNEVRERAGLAPLDGLSQVGFRAAIMQERAWELAAEGHRRFDLNRWGKLLEAVKSVSGSNPIGAANIKPYHVLFPIPPDEILKNPNLVQNDGYK